MSFIFVKSLTKKVDRMTNRMRWKGYSRPVNSIVENSKKDYVIYLHKKNNKKCCRDD